MKTKPNASERDSARLNRKRRPGRFLGAVGIGLVAVVAAVAANRQEGSTDAPDPSASATKRLQTVEVIALTEVAGYDVTDIFLGRVEAARSSDLGFELGGTLDRVLVDDGHHVEVGQVIAELNTDRLAARESEMEALVDQARATAEFTETVSARMETLVQTQAVSQQDLENATERRNAAAAGLRRAEAQWEAVRVDLAKSKLRAPFSGTVARRLADEGAMLALGQPVLTLLETDQLEVRAGISGAVARNLKVGDRLPVRPRDSREVEVEWNARIERILPLRDERMQTVDVILKMDETSTISAREGDLIELAFDRRIETPGFWLPRVSLTESARGLWAVYAVVPSEKDPNHSILETRQVEVIEQRGNDVFVRGALASGDRVVASGRQRLTPGLHVAPRETAPRGELLTRQ